MCLESLKSFQMPARASFFKKSPARNFCFNSAAAELCLRISHLLPPPLLVLAPQYVSWVLVYLRRCLLHFFRGCEAYHGAEFFLPRRRRRSRRGNRKSLLAGYVGWMWGIWGSGRYAVWYGMDGKGWREGEGERLYSYLRRTGATEVKRMKKEFSLEEISECSRP